MGVILRIAAVKLNAAFVVESIVKKDRRVKTEC